MENTESKQSINNVESEVPISVQSSSQETAPFSIDSKVEQKQESADSTQENRNKKEDEDMMSEAPTSPEASFAADTKAVVENREPSLSEAEIAQLLIDLSEVQEKNSKLTDEKKMIYEQLMRRQAEFDNFRKRVDRERIDLQSKTKGDIIMELLPVLDNLERALEQGSKPEVSDGVQEGILAGIKLIHRQFVDTLSNFGLVPIKAIGEVFDPHLHEAVTTEASEGYAENTVIEEFQRGYKIGERLLRPSMVKVALKK
ncbi:MAG: nucleotide exchange factor GrpE [Blastocatellia bacterium]|nr:nucleotide exchange factor GrpE [Blastocatellia bacterium]